MKHYIISILFLLSITLNAQWTLVPGTENMDIRNIIINQNTMYLGTGGYGLWRGDASGTWEKFDYQIGLDAVYVYDVVFLDSNIFVGTSQGIYKSSDNGASWAKVDEGKDFRIIYVMRLVGGKIFAGGSNGLFVSSDGGNTFVRNDTTFDSNGIWDILVIDGYIYTVGSKAHVSTDGGDNWTELLNDEGNSFYSSRALYYSNDIVFHGTHGDGIYVTSGVANYAPRNTGIEDVLADDIDGIDSTVVIAGWTNGVFISEDLGFNWTDVTGNLPNTYPQCVAVYGGYVYVGIISSGSDGLYKMPLPGTPVAIENDEELPVQFVLKQNYPNPFNPSTSIRYHVPVMDANFTSTTHVTLKVFDMLGREVATLVDEYQPAGTYEVRFDGSNLSSGAYFYKLTSGDFTSVKKLLLMK